MIANQKMYDSNGKQVALFPLPGFHISQRDDETFSHNPSLYYATDYLGWGSSGRIYRCPCYAPVDIKLLWKNQAECCAVWESLEKVHLSNGMIDYLTILVYHDNDIENNTYYSVGTIKRQGEIFNRTGTGGNVTGDHVHLETGYGKYNLSYSTGSGTPEYKFHITDYTTVKRLHNYNALYINDTNPYQSPGNYSWKTFQGGSPTPPGEKKEHHFPWVIYARKLRDKRS